MRQVFASARLENVEAVATLLREAGIDVRITNGRSYKGNRRTTNSYRDLDAKQPAVWVVKSDEQRRARELLRDAGLMESTRPGEGAKLSFRSEFGDETTRTPLQKRATRIKFALLGAIMVAVTMLLLRTGQTPAVIDRAAPPFDGHAIAVFPSMARAVFQRELAQVETPVACMGVDQRDATQDVLADLRPPHGLSIVPKSHCQRVADEDTGSFHPQSQRKATIVEVYQFRATAPDAGTVEFSAYHHRGSARYKTLAVKRVDGKWTVLRTLKYVAPM